MHSTTISSTPVHPFSLPSNGLRATDRGVASLSKTSAYGGTIQTFPPQGMDLFFGSRSTGQLDFSQLPEGGSQEEFEIFQKLRKPKFTHADLAKLQAKKEEKGLSWRERFKLWVYPAGLAREYFRLAPSQAKIRIVTYFFNPLGFTKDLLFPPRGENTKKGYAIRKIITMAGAPFVKHAQAMANFSGAIQDITQSEGVDTKKLLQSTTQRRGWIVSLGLFFSEAISGLFNQVPPVPFRKIQPRIEALAKAYDEAHPDRPDISLKEERSFLGFKRMRPTQFKLLGSGSIAQTYQIPLDSGESVIFKVLRPDVSPKYLEQYKKTLYQLNLLRRGTEVNDITKSYEEAVQMHSVIAKELNPDWEKKFSESIAKGFREDLKIPDLYFPEMILANEHGLIQEFIDGTTWSDLPSNLRSEYRYKLLPTIYGPLFMNTGSLDYHPGNVIVKGDLEKDPDNAKIYLIDMGRSYELDTQSYNNYMRFILQFLTANRNAVTQEIETTGNEDLQESINNLYNLDLGEDTLNRMLKALDFRGIPHNPGTTDPTQVGPDDFYITPRMYGYGTVSSLLEAAKLGKASCTLTGDNVVAKDLRTAHKSHRNLAFLYHRFHNPIQDAQGKILDDATLINSIQQLTPQEFSSWAAPFVSTQWGSYRFNPVSATGLPYSQLQQAHPNESNETLRKRTQLMVHLLNLQFSDLPKYTALMNELELSSPNKPWTDKTVEYTFKLQSDQPTSFAITGEDRTRLIEDQDIFHKMDTIPREKYLMWLVASSNPQGAWLAQGFDVTQEFQEIFGDTPWDDTNTKQVSVPINFAKGAPQFPADTITLTESDRQWVRDSLIRLRRATEFFQPYTENVVPFLMEKARALNVDVGSEEELKTAINTYLIRPLIHGKYPVDIKDLLAPESDDSVSGSEGSRSK